MANSDSQRDSRNFIDSLLNKTRLNITNETMYRWIVGEQYLYSKESHKILIYSITQCRVERELQHENYVLDFSFVGNSFLVSVGCDFVRVWNASDVRLLTSSNYETKTGYVTCIAVSPISFLYISGDIIRRLNIDIETPHLTAVQLQEFKMLTFDDLFIGPSEVRGDTIALVFEIEKKLIIFDMTIFKVTAHLDLSSHLTAGFELDNFRKYDVSFPDRVVFCVGDFAHSELKVLMLDPANLHVQHSFIVPNPIHPTLVKQSKLDEDHQV